MRRELIHQYIFAANNPEIDKDINWENLLLALRNAALYYLKKIEGGSQDIAGFHHGDEGINRASNLLKYLNTIDHHHHFALFCLLLSAVESSSTFLTQCIARYIILGQYQNISFTENTLVDTIESEVIDHSLLEHSKPHAFRTIPTSDLSSFTTYEKEWGLLFILNEMKEKIPTREERGKLCYQVGLFKAALIDDPKFFDPDTIPACEMTTITPTVSS